MAYPDKQNPVIIEYERRGDKYFRIEKTYSEKEVNMETLQQQKLDAEADEANSKKMKEALQAQIDTLNNL